MKQINRLCGAYGIDVVLPSCSQTTRLLSTIGHLIEASVYPVPTRAAFDVLDDKWRFAHACADLGLPVPPKRRFESVRELHDADLSHPGFPLILKPASMSGGYGVQRIDAPGALPSQLSYAPVICQKYVPGDELSAFYLCRSGEIQASFS